MSSLLALLSAALFGASDFLGGVAARLGSARVATLIAQAVGAVLLVPLVFAVPAPQVTAADIGWGAAAGGAGGLAILFFYTAFARGAMSVVAPLSALAAALVPVVFGLATGERPATIALVGVALALVAIPVVSAGGERGRTTASAVVLAAIAGVGFGVYSIFLKQTSVDAGLWPLLGTRLVSVPLMVVLAWTVDRSLRSSRPSMRAALGAGAFDIVANTCLLLALQRGDLSIAAVLSGLYPASTVLLARVVLGERLSVRQLAGLVVAGAAIALIAVA
jgi:uncharacterized membrane protein